MFASLLIMLLAVIEKPAVPYFEVQIWVSNLLINTPKQFLYIISIINLVFR